jgi:hypothetical protein
MLQNLFEDVFRNSSTVLLCLFTGCCILLDDVSCLDRRLVIFTFLSSMKSGQKVLFLVPTDRLSSTSHFNVCMDLTSRTVASRGVLEVAYQRSQNSFLTFSRDAMELGWKELSWLLG